jgi:hypothetical protein
MVGSIVIHNLLSNSSSCSVLAAIIQITDECETKKFVRAEMQKLQITLINIGPERSDADRRMGVDGDSHHLNWYWDGHVDLDWRDQRGRNGLQSK